MDATARRRWLHGVLTELAKGCDRNLDANSKQSRMYIQKTLYLLQSRGAVRDEYSFSLYLNGPYSPQLARDYYGPDGKPRVEPVELADLGFDPAVKEWILHALSEGLEFMEGAATLHLVHGRSTDLTPAQVVEWVAARKPHIDRATLTKAWDLLADAGVVHASSGPS